jgi:hypothetical protein
MNDELKIIGYKWLVSAWIVLLLFACGTPVWAQLQVGGFADSYHAVRIKEPNDFLSSRNRLRLEANTDFNNTNLFVSFNAMHNYILPEQTGVELREAWFDYASDNWDLRIGRQIIVWGKADGLRITDLISPYDLTEFLARDYDDIRIPVDAFKLRFLRESMDIELVWLPVFQPGILPGHGNPWAPKPPNFSEFKKVNIQNPQTPEKTLANSEFGGRISIYLPGIDLALSSFYSWNDFPLSRAQISGDTLTVYPYFYRYAFIGADFSTSLADFVLRGEAAFYFNEQFEAQNPRLGIYKRNSLIALMGLDWYPGGDWTLSAQIADDLIINYHRQITEDEHSWLCTISISKDMLRNTLKLSTFAYIGFDGGQLFNRSSIDYALTDEMHLLTGVDVFRGDKGMFGQFENNSEVWVKAKYSF